MISANHLNYSGSTPGYDESWSEWLDVTDETELEDRAKIKVVLLGKKEDASEETKSQAVEPTKIDAGMFLFLCMFLFYIFKNDTRLYCFCSYIYVSRNPNSFCHIKA